MTASHDTGTCPVCAEIVASEAWKVGQKKADEAATRAEDEQ